MRKKSQVNSRPIVLIWILNQLSGGFCFKQIQCITSSAFESILVVHGDWSCLKGIENSHWGWESGCRNNCP